MVQENVIVVLGVRGCAARWCRESSSDGGGGKEVGGSFL